MSEVCVCVCVSMYVCVCVRKCVYMCTNMAVVNVSRDEKSRFFLRIPITLAKFAKFHAEFQKTPLRSSVYSAAKNCASNRADTKWV